MSIWENELGLSYLELERDKKRIRDKLSGNDEVFTFDCFNTHFKEDKVYCTKGHSLHNMSLISCLRGRTAKICRDCPDKDI